MIEKLQAVIADAVHKGTGADNGERAWTADAILALPEMIAMLDVVAAAREWWIGGCHPDRTDEIVRAVRDFDAVVPKWTR